MKCMQLFQKYFSILSINLNEFEQTGIFKMKQFLWIPGFALNVILYAVFIFQEVNSFIEGMFSIYMISAVIGVGTGLASIAFSMQKISKYINLLERTINESEQQFFHSRFFIYFWYETDVMLMHSVCSVLAV